MSELSSLDFSPAGAPAPASRRVLRHGLMEARLIARNGEQAVLALVIPVGILVAGHLLDGRFGVDFAALAPSVLALAIWSSCFTSLAIATGFERRHGVLERLVSTPLGSSGVLLGKAVGITVITLAQLAVLAVVALLLGWRPEPGLLGTAQLPWVVLLGMLSFAALALALAGTLRAEATLGLANLIYLAGLVLGGIIWPADALPEPWSRLVAWTPTGALADALRAWSAGASTGWAWLILGLWSIVVIAVARKVFKWVE